jgi:deltex-like protein
MVTLESSQPECIIYLEEMSGPVARLDCAHQYHLECLKETAIREAKCPTCRQPFQQQTPYGQMPSGHMNVMRAPNVTCAGRAKGSLWIHYVFHKGRQQSYHPNPGQRYNGTSRAAFLPDTPQGHQLCSCLVEAFQYGLTSRVGTSLTSGLTDQITWASIPHKTKVEQQPAWLSRPSLLYQLQRSLGQSSCQAECNYRLVEIFRCLSSCRK